MQLFYVLSGYILYQLYSDKLEMLGATKSFYIKRFFRIAPLYYLVTFLAFVAFYSQIVDPWNNLISHLLIVGSGFSPTWINGIIGVEWSIFVEFSFYLFFPLLLSLFRRRKALILILTLSLSVSQTLLVYLVFPDIESRTYFYHLPTAQLCFFVLGMWVADLHKGTIGGQDKWWLALVALSFLVLLPFVIESFTVQLYISFVLLGFFVYSYRFLRLGRTPLVRAFLCYCGIRSYSIYLIHMPILTGFHLVCDCHGLLSWALLIAVVILISDMTFRVIEQKGMAWGKYVAQRL